MCIFVPATYGNFLSIILVTYFGDRREVGDLLFGEFIQIDCVLETDEISWDCSRFWNSIPFTRSQKIFASRLRMTEKKLQRQ